jgi:hypothetical protein
MIHTEQGQGWTFTHNDNTMLGEINSNGVYKTLNEGDVAEMLRTTDPGERTKLVKRHLETAVFMAQQRAQKGGRK